MSAPRSGLLASRFFEKRFQVALTAFFVGWGGFLALKKFTKNTPEAMHRDPLFEVHQSQEAADAANRDPASVKLAKKTGMVVTAKPGDPTADPIAAASGGAPLVREREFFFSVFFFFALYDSQDTFSSFLPIKKKKNIKNRSPGSSRTRRSQRGKSERPLRRRGAPRRRRRRARRSRGTEKEEEFFFLTNSVFFCSLLGR